MRITPIDIQQQSFKSRPMGYDKAGVDQFLEILAGEMERLLRQNQDLQEELTHARNALNEMRAREAMLKETLLTTQKVTDELKANARREVDLLLADAELRAERVIMTAEERRLQLVDEIREIKRQRIDFEETLRSLLEKHMRMLELNTLDAEGKSAESRSPVPPPPARPVPPFVAVPAETAPPPAPRPGPEAEVSFDIPLVDDSRRKPPL
jgi:cell division initiation protein